MIHLIPDLLILLIFGLTVFLAYKRGFVKTFISAISLLVALAVAAAFNAPLADALENTSLADSIKQQTTQAIDDLTADFAGGDVIKLASDPNSKLRPLLDSVGIDGDELDTWLDDHIGLAEDAFRQALVDYVAIPVIHMLLRILAAVLLFVGTWLLLKLIAFLLSGILEKIPFLRGANHALGIVLGVLQAIVRVVIFCFLLKYMLEAAPFAGIPLLSELDPQQSLLLRFLI